MAVSKVVEDWSERTVSGDATKLTAKRVYNVEFDNTDAPESRPLLAYCASDGQISVPDIYAVHSYNVWLYVKNKHVDTIGPCHYKVTVNYEATLDKDSGEPTTPLMEPATWSFHFVSSNEPIDRDEAGNPITNSSDESYDPPVTKDIHDLVLRIQRSEATFDPLRAYQYKGATNSDEFLGVPAGKVLCSVIDAGKAQAAALVYYKVTYEFQMRFDGWKLKLIDQGFREKTGTLSDGSPAYEAITNKDGSNVSQPAFLDGSGRKLTQAQIAAGTISIREFDIRRSLPFSVFNL